MTKISDFVSRQLLLNKLVTHFYHFNLIHSSVTFSSNKFKLGDWVINQYNIQDIDDLEYGKSPTSIGYVVGIVYEYQEWRIDKFKKGYSYFVRVNSILNKKNIYNDIFHESELKPLY